MNLRQCSQGHFYDEDRYGDECPHCKAGGLPPKPDTTNRTDKTEAINPELVNMKTATPGSGFALTDDQKTTKQDGWEDLPEEPVVGWLVCVKGENIGRDFRLHAGRNFVGRGEMMDVRIVGERSISRTNHAVIVYDPKSGSYLAQPGDSRELFYVNGEVVLASEPLHAYDVLDIGASTLIFLPLCGERFSWDPYLEAAKEEGGDKA